MTSKFLPMLKLEEFKISIYLEDLKDFMQSNNFKILPLEVREILAGTNYILSNYHATLLKRIQYHEYLSLK